MTTSTTPTKSDILQALYAWINQRPGLEYGNYGEPYSYRAELRSITKDKREASILLRSVEQSAITAEGLLEAFRAFSGRMTWNDRQLDYCTGQYWPTEYRRVVCAIAAQALWDYYREDFSASAKAGESAGDAIRRNFKRLYGKAIQLRWFN